MNNEFEELKSELQVLAWALKEREDKADFEMKKKVFQLCKFFTLLLIDELTYQRFGFDIDDMKTTLDRHSLERINQIRKQSIVAP